jgi:Spy/CpxP family protein refolding chaperone
MKAYKTEFLGLLSALGLLWMLAFTSSAIAADGPKDRMGGPGLDGPVMITERMANRLELDETQVKSINDIIEAAKPEFDALRERVQADVEAVLTEEQLAEFEQMKEQRRGKGDRRRKR